MPDVVDEVVEVVVTAADAVWLGHLVASLADERLIAYGNITRNVRTMYRWKGRIADEVEARACVHTRAGLVPAITERVLRDHPHELPCVLAVPAVGGSPAYLEWVLSETLDPANVAG